MMQEISSITSVCLSELPYEEQKEVFNKIVDMAIQVLGEQEKKEATSAEIAAMKGKVVQLNKLPQDRLNILKKILENLLPSTHHPNFPIRTNALCSKDINQWVQSQPKSMRTLLETIVKEIKNIPFDLFLKELKSSIDHFNLELSKEKDQRYIVIVERGKSEEWVLKLSETFLHMPPTLILTQEEYQEYKANDGSIKKVAIFDDGSYSAGQMGFHIDTIFQSFVSHNEKVHLKLKEIVKKALEAVALTGGTIAKNLRPLLEKELLPILENKEIYLKKLQNLEKIIPIEDHQSILAAFKNDETKNDIVFTIANWLKTTVLTSDKCEKLYVIIPFMTKHAEKEITRQLQVVDKPYFLASHKQIPVVSDFIKSESDKKRLLQFLASKQVVFDDQSVFDYLGCYYFENKIPDYLSFIGDSCELPISKTVPPYYIEKFNELCIEVLKELQNS
jgi:hypothetical protein